MNVSITDFGAVADGVTDNHDAIQKAFDYAHANGAAVVIPDGNFAYSGTLTADSIAVAGAGDGSILTALDGANESLALTGNGGSISSLHMDGVTAGRLSTPQSAEIWVHDATNFTVQNVHINGSSSVGIFNDNSSDGKVVNNTVEHTLADSIHTVNGSHDITIAGNQVLHSGDDGISIVSYQGSPIVHDITVDGNSVLSNDWGRSMSVVGGDNVHITGNHVEGGSADLAGVYISAESEWGTQGVSNVDVSGNTLMDAGGSGSGHGAITVYNSQGGGETIDGVTLSGNQIVDPRADGVLVTGAGQEQVNMDGNTVYTDGHGLMTNNAAAASVSDSGNQVLAASAFTTPLVAAGGGANAVSPDGSFSVSTDASGHQTFNFAQLPDHAPVVSDFVPGQDLLDLHSLMQAMNYQGTDPIADHTLSITQSGADAVIGIDPGGAPGATHDVVTLQHTAAASLQQGVDYVWH